MRNVKMRKEFSVMSCHRFNMWFTHQTWPNNSTGLIFLRTKISDWELVGRCQSPPVAPLCTARYTTHDLAKTQPGPQSCYATGKSLPKQPKFPQCVPNFSCCAFSWHPLLFHSLPNCLKPYFDIWAVGVWFIYFFIFFWNGTSGLFLWTVRWQEREYKRGGETCH